jgi:Mannitol repressor
MTPTADSLKRAYDFLFSTAMRHSAEVATMRGEDIGPFYEGLFAESERSMGILAFTFIESQIKEMFAQHLHTSSKSDAQKIIGRDGILDTVGKQINMLSALGWIRQETAGDLRLLARIRNRFAHAHTALTFDDEKIQGFLSSLTKHEERFVELGFDKDYPGAVLQTRHKFLVRTIGTLYSLYYELTLMPSSIRAGMGPTGAFGGDFGKYPQPLQDALGWCMQTIGLIYRDAAHFKPAADSAEKK